MNRECFGSTSRSAYEKKTDFPFEFFKLVGIGVFSVLVGLITIKKLQSAQRASERRHLESRLDEALADSMDCSDAVATY